jgi:spore coat protein CotH
MTKTSSEGHVVRRWDDRISFGGHVNWERIFSDYVDRRGSDSLTMRFGEEVKQNSPFQGQAKGEEVMKEVLGTMRSRNKF